MQNKGLIRTFAILLALVCVYQLTFTYKARQVERNAEVCSGRSCKTSELHGLYFRRGSL